MLNEIRVQGFAPRVNQWLDIKADVEIKIITGVYEVGKPIPSINEMAVIYDVGTTTTQKVLSALRDDKVLEFRRGGNYIVRPYVKESLAAQHLEELKNRLIAVAKYGERLGYDVDKLIELMNAVCRTHGDDNLK